jgi:hypothetical protein
MANELPPLAVEVRDEVIHGEQVNHPAPQALSKFRFPSGPESRFHRADAFIMRHIAEQSGI